MIALPYSIDLKEKSVEKYFFVWQNIQFTRYFFYQTQH